MSLQVFITSLEDIVWLIYVVFVKVYFRYQFFLINASREALLLDGQIRQCISLL